MWLFKRLCHTINLESNLFGFHITLTLMRLNSSFFIIKIGVFMDLVVQAKNDLTGMSLLVFIIGMFVLAFTKMNVMDTLRLIAQITLLVWLLMGLFALFNYIKKKYNKKQSKMIDPEERIESAS